MIRVFISFVFFFVFLQNSWSQFSDHKVRVRIYKNLSSIQISGLGIRIGKKNDLRPLLSGELKIHSSNEPQLIEADVLKINGKMAPNKVFYKKGSVVAEMNLEHYLKGVVASEMPASWPFEALKAQAVASRSYALGVIQQRKSKFFHLEATIMNQVFDYPKYKGLLSVYKRKIEKVIHETSGQYLVWKDSEALFRAYYHSHCGGGTEEPSHVWGVQKIAGVTQDESCALDPTSQWKLSLDEDELKERLLPELKLRQDLQITLIEKAGISKYGRAQRVKIHLGEKEVVFPANEFRKRMGFSQLKSTRFEIHKRGAQYTFKGQGYGHGAGLCQTGSRFMAKAGANYKGILAKYYPKAKINGMEKETKLGHEITESHSN